MPLLFVFGPGTAEGPTGVGVPSAHNGGLASAPSGWFSFLFCFVLPGLPLGISLSTTHTQMSQVLCFGDHKLRHCCLRLDSSVQVASLLWTCAFASLLKDYWVLNFILALKVCRFYLSISFLLGTPLFSHSFIKPALDIPAGWFFTFLMSTLHPWALKKSKKHQPFLFSG